MWPNFCVMRTRDFHLSCIWPSWARLGEWESLDLLRLWWRPRLPELSVEWAEEEPVREDKPYTRSNERELDGRGDLLCASSFLNDPFPNLNPNYPQVDKTRTTKKPAQLKNPQTLKLDWVGGI